MTRVLHVLEKLDWYGGVPRKLLLLASHAREAGVAYEFLVFFPGSLDPEFTKLGVRLRILGSAGPLDVVRGIIEASASAKADAVCTHFTRALICAVAGQPIHRRPILHSEHGTADLLGPRSLRAEWAGALRRFSIRRAAAVLCNSGYTRDTVRAAFNVVPERMKVIYDPVIGRPATGPGTLQAREGRRPMVEGEVLRLGHIGGMIPVRDQGTILRAAAILKSQDVPVHVTMVGDGPCRARLENEVAALGLQEEVLLTGYVQDVGQVLSSIDVYVNSTVAEGFGIAVVEAMLAGVPVVLADAGAHPELVVPGQSGLLFEPGDAPALARQLRWLRDNPREASRIAAAARARALDLYSPSRFADAYADHVHEALGRCRSSAT